MIKLHPKLLIALQLFVLSFLIINPLNGQSSKKMKYKTPTEQVAVFKQLNSKYASVTKIHYLAKSPGKQDVLLLEIGTELNAKKKLKPAVFVVANTEGDVPISSEAAIYLAEQVLSKAENYQKLNWYILPNANPDAALNFFAKIKNKDTRNKLPVNDDLDDQTDEDPLDDLNNDGFITKMRVKDIEGQWLISEEDPRMLRKADKSKGEKGIYKIYTEGIDNDKDGKYNEDGIGGTNVGINFPHLHKPYTAAGGIWPGSADECFAIMKFVDEHPEIAMTMTYGATNFCLNPPVGGRKGSADYSRIKLDKKQAQMLSAEPNKNYTMEEIIEMAKKVVPPGMEVTESLVASFLGLGAMVNPLSADLKFYNKLSEDYKEYLKSKKFEEERLAPKKAKDGSFELWVYYQIGVPSFSMDFWTLPKAKAKKADEKGLSLGKMEKMSKEDFAGISDSQLDSLLKANKAPKQFGAAKVKEMVAQDKMTPEKIAKMLDKGKKDKKKGGDENLKALLSYQDAHKNLKLFADWKPFKHPQLGEVEIGGAIPYAYNTPEESMLDSLLKVQVPWIFELTKELASLKIAKTEIKEQGGGVYKLELWVENTGYLPFPTAMGEKNSFGQPAVVELIGNVKFLSGKKRTPIHKVAGKGVNKISWLLQADSKPSVEIKLSTANAWNDSKVIKLGGK